MIDLDLVNLLKYCYELQKHYSQNDEYQDEIMMKSVTLGKVTHKKLLIFDMDETLIAAKYLSRLP